jgi:hypothetical protein
MTARKWGNAVPQAEGKRDAAAEIDDLKALLVAKGVLKKNDLPPPREGA